MGAKTANQLYRESNTTLSFKDWLHEKKLHADGSSAANIIIDKSLNDSVQSAIQIGKASEGIKSAPRGKTVLGIPNTAIYIVGGLTALYIGYQVYQSFKVK
jgi:hypothetical protein